MATVFHSQGIGKSIIIEDLTAKYGKPKVGRWAKPPYIPDRCDFCSLDDIRPSVGFVAEGDWRRGYCQFHRPYTPAPPIDEHDQRLLNEDKF